MKGIDSGTGLTAPCWFCGRRWSEVAIQAGVRTFPLHCAAHIYRETGVKVEAAPLLDLSTGEVIVACPVTGQIRSTGRKVRLAAVETAMGEQKSGPIVPPSDRAVEENPHRRRDGS